MPTRIEWPESEFSVNVYPVEWWDCPKCDFKKKISFNRKVYPNAMEDVQLHVHDHLLQ